MRTEELLEQCMQALSSGQELPPELARYLARHPEQRAEVEDMLFVAQRVSRLPAAQLNNERKAAMQGRLAEKLGFDPESLPKPGIEPVHAEQEQTVGRKPIFSIGRVSVTKLRYAPPPGPAEDEASARINAAFRDLTPDDVHRYIGARGMDYLYYRQRFPRWEIVFACIAFVLRGFKRLEKLANLNSF
jgi:hypothetical protein